MTNIDQIRQASISFIESRKYKSEKSRQFDLQLVKSRSDKMTLDIHHALQQAKVLKMKQQNFKPENLLPFPCIRRYLCKSCGEEHSREIDFALKREQHVVQGQCKICYNFLLELAQEFCLVHKQSKHMSYSNQSERKITAKFHRDEDEFIDKLYII